MSDPENGTEGLKTAVETGLGYYRDGLMSSFRRYASDQIMPQLEEVLKSRCGEIEQHHKFDHLSADPRDIPEFVIHYTSIATIVALLQAQAKKRVYESRVRATNPSNDAAESTSAQFESSLRLYDSGHFNDPDDGNYLARHLNPSGDHRWLKRSTTTHAYIASFIIPDTDPDAASDNLVFWRTYGREGEGCSLKLRPPKSELWRVLYEQDDIERTVTLLNPVLASLDSLSDVDTPWLQDALTSTIWDSLGTIQYLYKSPAYRYENECRVVIPSSRVVEERVAFEYKNETGRLRHYLEDEELDVTRILTSGCSITIGPCVADREDLQRSLNVLKRRAGLLGPDVKLSQISYRRV